MLAFMVAGGSDWGWALITSVGCGWEDRWPVSRLMVYANSIRGAWVIETVLTLLNGCGVVLGCNDETKE
jgi:hypothetical protein